MNAPPTKGLLAANLKGTAAKIPATYRLDKGQVLQFVQFDELSGSVISADKHLGKFEDVWLECAGTLEDFRPIGTRGEYEYTRVDLSRAGGPGQSFGDKTCRTGLQRMRSEGPFTATLWGWDFAASYAYPGGMAHRKLVTSPLVPVR